MSKKFIKEVKPYAKLYKDTNTGIAWIEDGSTGCGHSCHANIDSFVIDKENELDLIVAEECTCQGCIDRRARKIV